MPESPTDVIVAGIDGSAQALSAARWAARDAELRGATLRLVHAVVAEPTANYPEPALVRPQVTADMRVLAGDLLRTTAGVLTLDHPGLRIDTLQQDGPPVKVLLDQSREGNVATVVGADGQGRLAGALLGSVTTRVVARGHGCIVVARPYSAGTDSRNGVVAVGVDGSPQARAAIGFAYEEAALRGVPLLAIHTWNDKPLSHAPGATPANLDAARRDDQVDGLLQVELAGWDQKYPDVPLRMRVLRGRPATHLLRYTTATGSDRAQLMVVGSRGRGELAGLLLGSTSQAVVAHAGCSVAVVHETRQGHLTRAG